MTLGEVEKIAPDAIWRLAISSDATRSAFSHSLGQELTFVYGLNRRINYAYLQTSCIAASLLIMLVSGRM